MLSYMLSCTMDGSCWKQVMNCSDDGGELWRQVIKCLKVGMRGHYGCGALSRSRRLGASSLPLEPRMSALPFGGVYGALVDQLTWAGLARVL